MSVDTDPKPYNEKTVSGARMLPEESFRGVQEIFNDAVEAEERLHLMEALIEKGVGVPSIEHYHRKQTIACRVRKNVKRKSNSINKDMKFKLKDARDHLKKVQRRKCRVVKRINTVLGDVNGKLFRKELEEKSQRLRGNIKLKNEEKVDHLSQKYLPDKDSVPDMLDRYKDSLLFGDYEKISFHPTDQPLIYGNLNMDEDERSALLLDPKFAVFDNLDEESFETEIEIAQAKMRWNSYDKGEEEEDEVELSEKEQERIDIIDAKMRQVYDSDSKIFDMRKLRATDVKLNNQVYLPKPQGVKYEAGLEMRRSKYLETFRQYAKENCDEKGRQKSNLTISEMRGLKKLKKRISEGEIIICQTDKSGRLAVMPMDMYHEAAMVHIGKDVEVDFEEAEKTQNLLNGHVSMWLKMTGMGAQWEHESRQRSTHIEDSVSIAPLYLLVKDHKECKPNCPPSTRPVCGAISGMNVHLSNIISPYLDALADEMPDTMEAISSEDCLSRIDRFNKNFDSGGNAEKISFQQTGDVEYGTDEEEFMDPEDIIEAQKDEKKQHESIVICGADVCSMFPSLDAKHTAKLVKEAAIESEIKFEGIDYKEVATYLAINLRSWEARKDGFYKLLPRRKYRTGQKPTITGKSAAGAESSHDDHWWYPRKEYTEEEKRFLFSKALEIGTLTLFQNHLYQFGGRIYKQRNGGPIGVSTSMSASRIVMGMFDRRLKWTMEESKLEAVVRFRYVDDLRIIMGAIKEGWRWEKGRMKFRKTWEIEELKKGMSRSEKTAIEMNKIMNDIFPELKFEMEYPEMFDTGRLPTLDFECFVEYGLIKYSFYQKPMAKKTLIARKSALPENTKVASLSQNLVRRMKHCSELLPDSERKRIVDTFANQVHGSGYSESQTKKIIRAGLTGYENLRKKVLQGKARMHRSAGEGYEGRKRKKLLDPGNWFKQKKGKEKKSFPSNQKGRKKKEKLINEEPELVTVMFVPQTPYGALAKDLQKVENEIAKLTGEKIRMVERGGTKIKDLLHKSNPWANGLCGRPNCLVCMNGDGKQNCSEKNIVYEIICLKCGEKQSGPDAGIKEGVRTCYVGTSSRTMYQRGAEHLDGLVNKKESNALYKHIVDVHGGEYVDFKMVVVKRHFSAMSRLLHESVRINRSARNPSIRILNSKAEFGFYNLPRLVVDATEEESKKVNSDKKKAEEGGEEKKSFLDSLKTVLDSSNKDQKNNRESKESNGPVKRKLETDDHGKKLEHQSRNNIFDCFNKKTTLKASVVTGDTKTKPNLGGQKTSRRKHKHVARNFKFKQKLTVTSEEVKILKRNFGLF